jgi:hypothetical protein
MVAGAREISISDLTSHGHSTSKNKKHHDEMTNYK